MRTARRNQAESCVKLVKPDRAGTIKRMEFETRAIHAGQEPDPATGAVITPIYQTSTYVQDELGKHKGFEYGRTQNPTRLAVEHNLAAIEGGNAAFAFASGMAAIAAIVLFGKLNWVVMVVVVTLIGVDHPPIRDDGSTGPIGPRAIAGLWPWGGGKLEIQSGARLLMLPQRAYIPLGTLRRAVTYPKGIDEVPREEVAQAMDEVGLGHLVDRLDEDKSWDQTLSGGEKQRVAFARLFVHKPDIIVMDEATSALDPKSQEQLLKLIQERLPKTTIISVGHRPELEAFHERKLVLEARQEGAKLVRDIELPKGRRKPRWRWPRRARRGSAARQAAE